MQKIDYNDYISEISWPDARKLLSQGDPVVRKIFEDIGPNAELSFIRVRYPYGMTILHENKIYLPISHQQSVPLHQHPLSNILGKNLGYQSVPFGVIAKNKMEIYQEYADKIFSVCLCEPKDGMEFGIFEYISPYNTHYSVCSGARSAFMVPKISEARNHKRLLKAYEIECHAPKNILKHAPVFHKLSVSPYFKTEWECEILYLTSGWNDKLSDPSPAWQALRSHVLWKGCRHSELGRRKLILDLNWQSIVDLIKAEGLKPDPYTIDTLKHLILMFLGSPSGSRPVVDDSAGPFAEIQNIYLDCYGLTQIPTIMQPARFDSQLNLPVYYSMQSPMALSSTPTFRKMETIVEEMRELIALKSFVLNNPSLTHQKLNQDLSALELTFYHSDLFAYGKSICPNYELPEVDPAFKHLPDARYTHYKFAENGPFVKGCVAISKRHD